MKNKYEVYYNEEDDTIEFVKTPSRKPVQVEDGKYGVEFHKDITGNTVKIVIPECSILFGVKQKDVESFLLYTAQEF